MYIRVITDNSKLLLKGEFSSRCLDNMIVEHGVQNSSSRVQGLRIKNFLEKLAQNICVEMTGGAISDRSM